MNARTAIPRSAIPSPLKGRRPILVTGGAGFIGSNLVDRLAGEGHDVIVLDALARPGVEANLDWLKSRHKRRISTIIGDVRDPAAVDEATRDCAAVFHFAAQVAVTTSFADPIGDFETNIKGTLLLLEALRRKSHPPPLIFASTNKVYGSLSDLAVRRIGKAYVPDEPDIRKFGLGENRPLEFCTPYGCSKGAADQYVLDYARNLGVPTVVMRMSCIYGPRQMGTEDQGWVAHFLISALSDAQVTIYGDGCQVRDILDVADAVEAYVTALRRIEDVKGSVFNLGGGPANAVSLLQVIRSIERITSHPMHLVFREWRPGDQRYYVSDTRKISKALGISFMRPWDRGVAALAQWLVSDRSVPLAPDHTDSTVAALT